MQEVTNPISAWESYYVIVGSSGAALTGLQFVVIALTTELRRRRSTAQFEAFGTPTIVHFCAALLISAILSAPWRELERRHRDRSHGRPRASLHGGGGAARQEANALRARVRGLALSHRASVSRVRHCALSRAHIGPCALIIPLFGVGSASILLLFIGIHNAWDSVTYIATMPENGDTMQTEPMAAAGATEESQAT